MRKIWSEVHKRRLMRRVWVALAKAQSQVGLVSAEQLADLQRSVDQIDSELSHVANCNSALSSSPGIGLCRVLPEPTRSAVHGSFRQ